MRNILVRIPHREKAGWAERLKWTWLHSDKPSALAVASLFIQEYEKRFPEAIGCLDAGLERSLQFYEFPEIAKRKVSSTNMVKRIIWEVRRRSRVIGVIPNQESYVRLITCYLIEYSEDWINERSYIKQDSLIITMEASETQLATQAAS